MYKIQNKIISLFIIPMLIIGFSVVIAPPVYAANTIPTTAYTAACAIEPYTSTTGLASIGPAKAIDGVISDASRWAYNGSAWTVGDVTTKYVTYDLGSLKSFNTISFYMNRFVNFNLHSFSLQYSDTLDASLLNQTPTILSFSTNSKDDIAGTYPIRKYTVPRLTENITARYVRFAFTYVSLNTVNPASPACPIEIFLELGADLTMQDAYDALQVGLDNNADLGYVTDDLTLPTIGINGATIHWSSDHETVINSATGTVTRPKSGSSNEVVNLTATISKSGFNSLTKQFQITVIEEYAGYVMSYFGGGNGSSNLFLAYSTDGLNWTAFNNNLPILSATIGTKSIRDPYIVRKQDGSFIVLATNNWNSPQIFMWDTTDLITFHNQRLMTMNSTGMHAWAPECIYDKASKNYLIYWSGACTYANTTTDFLTVSEPFKLFDPGYTEIDADITQFAGSYYLTFKDERGTNDVSTPYKALKMAKSDTLEAGSFSVFTPDYITDHLVEGPALIKSLTENKWYLYYDYFMNHKWGCSVTTDLNSNSWTKLDESQFRLPAGVRHGNAIAVTQAELDKMLYFYQGGYACTLSNLNIENDNINVYLKNNTSDIKNVSVIYAVYRENKLVGIKISPQNIIADENKSLQQLAPIPQGTAWDTIKVFVFENNLSNLKAIAQNISVSNNTN